MYKQQTKLRLVRPSFLLAALMLIVLSNRLLAQNPGNGCAMWSSYFGGNLFDEIKGIATDTSGNVYLTGYTTSADLPTTPGLISDTLMGNYDAFVAKFDSCGTLLWCTYVGTPGYDSGEKITVCQDGHIALAGYTGDTGLPTTSTVFQPNNGGVYDGFILKLFPNGSLDWCTYFGKAGGDFIYDITCDKHNNLIIGGTSTSSDLYTTATSFQQFQKGATDAFLARFSGNGQFQWCTYYGGGGSEDIHALCVDDSLNIFGTGGTFSNNLSTTANCLQASNDGGMDIYLIKLDSLGNRRWSTYMGGTGTDDAYGAETDPAGNLYLSGPTSSPDFDTTPGCYQPFSNGLYELYAAKFSPGGALVWSTLFGGSNNENVNRLAVNQGGEIIILGLSSSVDAPILGTGNQQATLGGNYDVFLVKFLPDGTPFWSSYYGGMYDELGNDIIFSDTKTIYFVGTSNSPDYPVSANPYQNSLSGSDDGFMTKWSTPSQVVIPPPTAIETYGIYNQFQLWPNPATDYVMTGSVQLKEAVLYSASGQMLQTLRIENGSLIRLPELEPGLYFLQGTTQEGVPGHARFIKR